MRSSIFVDSANVFISIGIVFTCILKNGYYENNKVTERGSEGVTGEGLEVGSSTGAGWWVGVPLAVSVEIFPETRREGDSTFWSKPLALNVTGGLGLVLNFALALLMTKLVLWEVAVTGTETLMSSTKVSLKIFNWKKMKLEAF